MTAHDNRVQPAASKGEFRKCEQLWFEDGNIIIVAENLGFRVYCGLLASISSVFMDLFSLSQPEGHELVEGCPVVRVTDSEADMKPFLTVIYNGSSIWKFNSTLPHYWAYTRSILLMSHKYQCEALLEEGKRKLSELVPSDIRVRDRVRPRIESDDFISVANVARFLDMRAVHRRALYECCQLDTIILTTGWVDEDGFRDRLCAEDVQACLAGRVRLSQERIKVLLNRFKETPPTRCAHSKTNPLSKYSFLDPAIFARPDTRCITVRKELLSMSVELATQGISYDPLALDPIYQSLPYGFCEPCTKSFTQTNRKLRQDILDNLVELFELPRIRPPTPEVEPAEDLEVGEDSEGAGEDAGMDEGEGEVDGEGEEDAEEFEED
ncbi:hypothetical protein BXZ70DRAFT_1062729 [Cristinia sonorae]|uniref:BTB domain-containing protein n=1 Tax=Cristinia sonorae TaxID=1940300 RepID=A0A8K0UUB8_9AGAR|nr:hypothetical protein BXZ70DRAFT_1062729 [Cristinia sonorae]